MSNQRFPRIDRELVSGWLAMVATIALIAVVIVGFGGGAP